MKGKTMNRYLLFLILVGLQANIALSNPIKDFFNSAFRYFKPTTAYAFGGGKAQSNRAEEQLIREPQEHPITQPQQCYPSLSIDRNYDTPLVKAQKKQMLMDRLKRCHKYPEETIAVINEVEKKVHHYVGNKLNGEQRKNMDRFKNVCNEHIIKSMDNLSYIDDENIKKMPSEELENCTIALANAQRTYFEGLDLAHLLAHVLKGPMENDTLKKMAKKCKDRRKFINSFLKDRGYPIETFRDKFDSVAHISTLHDSGKDRAYALSNACSQYAKYVLRGNPHTEDKLKKVYNEAVKCVAKYAKIREEDQGREERQVQEASQKVYNAFDTKNPGDISYLFRGPRVNQETIKKTVRACKQDLINKQNNKNREE